MANAKQCENNVSGKSKFTEAVRSETGLLGLCIIEYVLCSRTYHYCIINNYLKCRGNGRRAITVEIAKIDPRRKNFRQL